MIERSKIEEFVQLKTSIDGQIKEGVSDALLCNLQKLMELTNGIELKFSGDGEDAASVWGYISDTYYSIGCIDDAVMASAKQLDSLIFAFKICNDDKKESILDRISDSLYNIIEYKNRIKYQLDYVNGDKFADDPCQEYMDKVNGILQDAPNVYIHATNRAKNAFSAG